MKQFLSIGAIALMALAALTGCQKSSPPRYASFEPARAGAAQMTTVTNRIEAAWLRQPTNLFTLGPGDRLEIELLDDPASRVTTIVGPDGKIYFNLLPGIDVWGLTLSQTKMQMESELAKYIRGTPRVNL